MTLFIITYDVVAPRKARIFYHVYGEIVLELFLIVFWVTSFAGMGSYVSENSLFVGIIAKFGEGARGFNDKAADLASNTNRSQNCSIAIAILGAFVLCVIEFLSIFSLLSIATFAAFPHLTFAQVRKGSRCSLDPKQLTGACKLHGAYRLRRPRSNKRYSG